MIEFLSSTALAALITYWPVTAAILVVAAAMAPRNNAPPPWRGYLVASAIAASGVGATIIPLSQDGSPLIRDVVAVFILALLAPGLTVALSVVLRSAPTVTRFFAAFATGLVFLCASPLFLLVVHCTSGDCL